MKPVLIIVIITALLNLFYTPGHELWRWGFLKITTEGIWSALYACCAFSCSSPAPARLTYTTSPILLTDGLEKLLSPLRSSSASPSMSWP